MFRSRNASRDSQILKLSREGWTNSEIADVVGLTEEAVRIITKNFNPKEIWDLYYDKGTKPEKLCKLC